ncbi:MAG: hypothetical protein P0Y56_08865 [Candidatus Andeanibacterium colombiense]|uniref:Uncharacterized protein n=1 Tax=Candidatus Andeanibacterium colombiense TaxID=3121345 RepID=A0AAJ5X230_9SPHN|nr:MAG: hypothetical protein P0Y56_08865 [Sphingomonadaceae bacterium]
MILTIILAAAAAAEPLPAAAADATCSKPVFINSPTVTPTVMSSQMKQAQDYIDCMSKAITAQRSLAEQSLQTAQAAAQKTNGMITDLNDFITKAKAYEEEHSGN